MAVWKKNILLLLAATIICIAPLLLLRNAEFSGADNQASDTISEITPDYEPWFGSIMEPASGEVESFLFALQAGIGGCVVGFVLGRISAGRTRGGNSE